MQSVNGCSLLTHICTFHNHMQMIGLYRDPQGEKIFEVSRSLSTSNATETSNATLRKKVTELERKLTQVRTG